MAKKKTSPGIAFEGDLKLTMDAYREAGIADIEKVGPPTVSIRKPGRSKPEIRFLANPWLDFTGCWNEFGGKMIHVEAKTTITDQLPVREDSDLRWHQVKNGLRWEAAGCAVIYIWRFNHKLRWFTPRMLAARITAGHRHMRWCDAHPVPQGPGFIFYDFLAPLRRIQNHKTANL